MVEIIRLHGYAIDCDRRMQPRTESSAIDGHGNQWSHFAKYENGSWSCKIGEDHDIAFASLALIEGDLYGKVVRVLSRPIK